VDGETLLAIVLIGGSILAVVASVIWFVLWDRRSRRDQQEQYLLRERMHAALMDDSLTPDEKEAITGEIRAELTRRLERRLFGHKGVPSYDVLDLTKANHELREENARLRAELSSRRR
jgi:hypothetical protein